MNTPPVGLGQDSRALDGLRREAARDPKSATRQAAVQFEQLFMQMVVKSMREATPRSDAALGGGSGGESFTAMLDSQFARQFAGRPHGLTDMIEKQLARQMQALPAVSPQNAAAPVATSPARPVAAATGPHAPGETGGAPADFVRRMLPHAQEAERRTGVPAGYLIGQAALESGWGRAEIRNADGSPSHNLFGIKAGGSWPGAVAQVNTTEYVDGEAQAQRAAFRSYGSYAEAFSDYARLISSPRYAAVRQPASAEAFADGLQRAGYATDPRYAAKLSRTIAQTLALQRSLG